MIIIQLDLSRFNLTFSNIRQFWFEIWLAKYWDKIGPTWANHEKGQAIILCIKNRTKASTSSLSTTTIITTIWKYTTSSNLEKNILFSLFHILSRTSNKKDMDDGDSDGDGKGHTDGDGDSDDSGDSERSNVYM